jgi:dUTP pyrophosphatase
MSAHCRMQDASVPLCQIYSRSGTVRELWWCTHRSFSLSSAMIKSMQIPIKRFNKTFPLPDYEKGAACFDLICRESVTILPREIKAIAQNIALKVPIGYVLLIFSRSSTPLRKGLMTVNGVGVVDPFYCGDEDENFAFFLNISDKPVTVEAGDKLVQGMIIKTESVSWQEVTSMNDTGHGGYQHFDDLMKETKL